MRSLATPRTRFGQWGGCPDGVPADPTRCNYEVFPEYLWPCDCGSGLMVRMCNVCVERAVTATAAMIRRYAR